MLKIDMKKNIKTENYMKNLQKGLKNLMENC